MTRVMIRTHLKIDADTYSLSQGTDIEELKNQVRACVRSGGDFLEFVVVGNRLVSAFVSRRSRVVLSVETVRHDSRDTGDREHPYGGFFDYEY